MGDWCNTILSFIGDVIPELIGAAFGVFIGYLYGLEQDRKSRGEDEKKRKEHMIKSLITEVTDNKRLLDDGLKEKRFSANLNMTYFDSILSTDAFDSTVFSSGYQLLTVQTQRCATYYFNGCKRMNRLLERLEYGIISENEARHVSSEILRFYSALKMHTCDILSKLQEELGYTWVIRIREENELIPKTLR